MFGGSEPRWVQGLIGEGMARTDGRHHPERDQFFDLGLGVHVVDGSHLQIDPAVAEGRTGLQLLCPEPERDARRLLLGQAQQAGGQRRTDQVCRLEGESAAQGGGLVPPNASLTPEDAWTGFTRPAARALAAHGVGHVVGVSALGRGTPLADRAGLVTASLAMDDLLARSGVAYRALASPSFFENLLEEATSIRDEGVFSDAADADRKAPMVAVADTAAVAADLLLDRSWTGTGSVPVLGPQDLSPNDLARIMTEQLGRPVRFERQSLDELRADLVGYGLDVEFVQGIVDMKRAKDEGLDAGVARTPDTAGRTTFENWCAETLKPAVLS